MEDLNMQVCPICGITYKEREIQEELLSAQQRLRLERWKQRNDPKEPAPGLPVTDEHRVHAALFFYQNDPSKKANVKIDSAAITRAAKEAGADHDSVVKAFKYANSIS